MEYHYNTFLFSPYILTSLFLFYILLTSHLSSYSFQLFSCFLYPTISSALYEHSIEVPGVIRSLEYALDVEILHQKPRKDVARGEGRIKIRGRYLGSKKLKAVIQIERKGFKGWQALTKEAQCGTEGTA
jgi:hypothetical protein